MRTKFFKESLFVFLLMDIILFLLFGCLNNPASTQKEKANTIDNATTAGQMVVESFKEVDSLFSFFEVAQEGLSALSFENEFYLTEVSTLAKKSLRKIKSVKDIGASVTVNFDLTSSGKFYIIITTSTNILNSYDTAQMG